MSKNKLAALAALMLGYAGTSLAVPFTWTDEAGNPGTRIAVGDSYQYQHNITDGVDGFRAGIDSIGSASLSIWLLDDSFFGDIPLLGDAEETVGFRFDNGAWTSSRSVDSAFWSLDQFDFTVSSLLSDGLLNVIIWANSGDFLFGGSVLSVSGERTSVPEPGTLGLLGLGLLATGFAKRRRRA